MIWLIKYGRGLLYGLLLLLLAGLSAAGPYFHGKYRAAKKQLTAQQAVINDMQRRQKSVAALDARYTKEREDAQNHIQQLHADVAAGRRRLQLNATCEKSSAAARTGRVGDVARARPADAAERDYFTLRGRIDTVTRQVGYLQQYIKTQCLR